MKSTEELMPEILRRSEVRKRKTQKKRVRAYALMSAGLLSLLVGIIYSFAGFSALETTGSVLGAVLLGPETGGYILTSLLAFAAGVMVTLTVQNHRRNRDNPEEMHGERE